MPNLKKLTAIFAAGMIAFGSMITAGATADAPQTEPETAAEDIQPANTGGIYMEDPGLDEPDTSHAEAALLMDFNSGRLIYGKNIDERLFPASTTKMMTAILALESGKMEDTVEATFDALKTITLEDSHMGILVGEQLTMTDLLNGMMIASANDAANVIAIHVGGSIEGFVAMMNAKAQELGMTGTNFVNPCGVHDDNHYTTAQDLAILAKYCMKNETFREIVKKPSYHIDPTNRYSFNRDLPTTNLFLGTARSPYYYYKPCTGIKTGTTEAAGHCLVASAAYENMNLLTVVLKCDDLDVGQNAYSYIVSRNLFDFGFDHYRSETLAVPGNIVSDSKVKEAKRDKRVTLTVDSEINALLPSSNQDVMGDIETVVELSGEPIAPIIKGDVLGTVTYKYRGSVIGSASLIAANDVEQNIFLHIFHVAIGIILNPLVFIPLILLIIVAFIAKARKKRMERKRRIQYLKQKRGYTDAYDRKTESSNINRARSKGTNSRYSGDKRSY